MSTAISARRAMGARFAPIATGCALAAAGAYVALNDPSAAGSRFPACTFKTFTGLWCPGCGLTRGMHALFTGDVAAAVSSNVFTPLVAVVILAAWWSWTRRSFDPSARPLMTRVPWLWWVGCAALLVVYGVLRNVPAGPLRALAP